MRDFYYKLKEGEKLKMADHLNTLDHYVKSPIVLAFGILTEVVDVSIESGSEEKADEINNCLATIQAALIAWEQIDKMMIADNAKLEE